MASTQPVTAGLFVRSLVTAGNGRRLEGTVTTLTELEAAGELQGVDVTVWGDKLPIGGELVEADATASLLCQVEQLREWARRADADLLGFEECTVGTLVEQSRPALSLPEMTMVEYRDGEIEKVTPHVRDGVITTVEDHLGALGSEEVEAAADPVLTS